MDLVIDEREGGVPIKTEVESANKAMEQVPFFAFNFAHFAYLVIHNLIK